MDATGWKRADEKQRLLQRLTELLVEEQREAGVYTRVPHYSRLEQAAHALGQEVSRLGQQRAVAEVAAECAPAAACPSCGEQHEVHLEKRMITSVDGPVEVVEPVAYCRPCRRSFFPSA